LGEGKYLEITQNETLPILRQIQKLNIPDEKQALELIDSGLLTDNLQTAINTIKRKKLMKVQLNSIEPIKQNEIPMQKINVNAKKNRFQMTLGEIICSSITCGSKHGCCEKKRNYNSNNISNYERKKIFLLFK
jgi:hypothetical protein